MRALQINAYGAALALNDVAERAPAGREVLVRVHSCGMCHSDLHLHSGGFHAGGGVKQSVEGSHSLPHTLGHEIEGQIAALGPDAVLPPGLGLGSRVAVYPWTGCGQCEACQAGEENICGAPRHLGIHAAGGFAEQVVVPDGRYLLPAEGLAPGRAGLMMCSGLTVFAALERCGVAGSARPLLILGAGGLGLTACHLARLMGGAAPVVADISPRARQAALQAGARAVLDPADPAAAEQAIALSGAGFAAAIDFVGAEATLSLALASARKGAHIVVVGLFGGLLTLPILQLPGRQLTLAGSMTGTLDQARRLLDLVRARGMPDVPVTVLPLAEGEAARQRLEAGEVTGRLVLQTGG